MLQLIDIRKSYTTASFSQVALDDISISFRDNEFVAVLGPSGSGKTTMLNIVGGLDHYDSGNLVIDGISTEQYKDRDWDTYRNNRIGFVFQSYNLIPHQTVLANVELALTLSGVSRTERRERATEALKKVGLGDHMDKKPSQLSGGQMQRVAIARALINDPEILLADEPTGALDSKTSVQIMALLTEIANDRLVIMVTHNPELAEEYATRIVNLSDGVITSDSDPYNPTPEEIEEHQSEKAPRRTSMSFLTALSLSFNNLMTKKGRTLMTAFAGSIGIIGIAAILALANGVNNYIKSVEEDTLSQYPLQIQSTGLDLTSMMMGSAAGVTQDDDAGDAEGQIHETKMITRMFSSIGSNDLASLKEYLDSGESDIEQYVNSIQYSYDVTPQIFSSDTEDGVRQVNPDKSFSALGLGSSASSNSLMSMSMSTDTFYEMSDDRRLIEEQYDVVAGAWPQNYDELVVVLTGNGNVSDFLLYTLGLRDPDELADMVKKFAAEEDVEVPEDRLAVSYEDILDVTFKLVNPTEYYQYDEEYGVWKDKTDDTEYMKKIVGDGENIKISGIVMPKPDATITALSTGIYYTSDLTDHVIEQSADTQIVKDQLADPTIDVFSGKSFTEEDEEADNGFDMNSLFTIDGDALQSAFVIDESALAVDMSNSLDLQSAAANLPDAPQPDMGSIIDSMNIQIPTDQVASLMAQIMQGYAAYLQQYATQVPPMIANPDDPTGAPIPNPDYNPMTAEQFLASPEVQAQIAGAMQGMVDTDQLEAQVATALQSYVQTTMTTYMNLMAQSLQSQVTSALQQSMNQMASNMANAMHIDEEAFKEAFQMNMDETELTELMMSLMRVEEHSYDNNLKKLGYASFDKPSGIDIYPIDFESKAKIIDILDGYNEKMKADGEEDRVITYTDFVGALMSSVTDIINMISYVLVAFVAISLVVSSIMIGVITYISVLERKKEIGILRSIGASKGDISRVFNAETLIVGFVAGAIGIGVTALACIPANAIVYSLFDVKDVASLPWQAALILVAISMALTFLAGLIPSRAASRKDPVEALRSE
ncbi:ABC transporter ATP-binding protein/permease [Raoultibacter phocaeensis]|uniref:ABC transporter ATP-binding protein/permease n=1 Tax=Raoultibacter phocaeensis TaxID=2479841 RepID=UPI00111B2BBD|nr:ABC transporter ATP-binding protein/permease [Raoultibacter phocaeensis]